MTTPTKNTRCKLGCWAVSLAITLVTTVGCLLLGEMMITGALFLGIVVFFVFRAMLGWILCRPLPPLGRPVKGAGATEYTGSSSKAASAQAAEAISTLAGSGLKSSIFLAVVWLMTSCGLKRLGQIWNNFVISSGSCILTNSRTGVTMKWLGCMQILKGLRVA